MKILDGAKLKKWDAYSIKTQNIASFELMQRAVETLWQRFKEHLVIGQKTVIFCGKGNNGGDGLVLAKWLYDHNFDFQVFLLESENYSSDNLKAQQNLKSLGVSIQLFSLEENFDFTPFSIVVDALFGYGINSVLSHDWQHIVQQINGSQKYIVSIDMPSGLLLDQPMPANALGIHANMVYTFEAMKIGLLLPDNQDFVGDFKCLPIGLDKSFLNDVESNYAYQQKEDIVPLIKPNHRFDHKGIFGHALVIGGSYGKIGSVVLSASAALKTGCGLLTTYTPKCAYDIIQTSVPEAMAATDDFDYQIEIFPEINSFSAVGIGIGLGKELTTKQAFTQFLRREYLNRNQWRGKWVLDADALNLLAEEPELLTFLPENTILTPHPKELQRLIGTWENDYEKLEKTSAFCATYKVLTIVKGANSAICLPKGEIIFNSTGNSGMGTGGAGDVLTGMLTSLLAQKYEPVDACKIGVFLHGLAGDLAAKELGKKSLIASDIVKNINKAYQIL